MNKKYAKLLEAIVNEDEGTAEEIFHNIVVETSRQIYLEQAEEAFEEMVDEEDAIEEDEEVDEDAALPGGGPSPDTMGEGTDLDEADEYGDEGMGDDYSDEEGGYGDMGDDFEDEIGADEAGLTMDDAEDDLEGDMDGEYSDEEGMDGEYGDEEGTEGLELRVVDLEAELDELKAEFDQMMGDEGMGDDGMGDEYGDDEGMGDDYDDDEEDSPFESKKSKKRKLESKPARKRSQTEIMREYVNVIDSTPGADKKDSETGADHTKSAVAGPNDMGGTTANLGGREGSKGKHDNSAYSMTSKEDSAGNVNVPGGKAGYKHLKNRPEGHGSEKKGKAAQDDSAAKSLFHKNPVRGK